MELIHIILPILLGALIGYCTNYIAIKMLFHPKKEVYIGKWKLPFTPGVIPKNQSRIAKAVGNTISGQLFTASDLTEKLKSSNVKNSFVSKIADIVSSSEISLRELANGNEALEDLPETISNSVYRMISEGISNSDLTSIIREVAQGAIGDFLQNPLFAMFLNDNMLDAIYEKLGVSIKEYVQGNGKDAICVIVSEQVKEIMDKPIRDNLSSLDVHRSDIENIAEGIFDSAVIPYGTALIGEINIGKIVRDKVEAMDADALEVLVMSVMKNELQAVINLGAVIGAIIGIINVFV